MPITANANPALQQRLVAAGPFDELDALGWGGHPYLPKVQFVPSARHLADQAGMTARMLDRARPGLEERMRAAGLPDFESMVEAKLREAEAQDPGRLVLDVEAGSAKVPSAARFRELPEHACTSPRSTSRPTFSSKASLLPRPGGRRYRRPGRLAFDGGAHEHLSARDGSTAPRSRAERCPDQVRYVRRGYRAA